MYQKRYLTDLTPIRTYDENEPASARVRTNYEVSSEPHRPFSYYVLGGVDIGGKALRMDGHAMYDSEEDLSLMAGSDAVCDPRIGFLDIAEQAGIDAAERALENKPE